MTSAHQEPVSPYSDYEDRNPFNPAAKDSLDQADYPHAARDCDVPMASVEDDDLASSFSAADRRRRMSGFTASSISSFPSDISVALHEEAFDSQNRYTPMRSRPAFRNTSSVKAMQMGSPPPSSPVRSPRLARVQQLNTPVRRSQTPRSQRSHSLLSDHQLEIRGEDVRRTPIAEPQRQQYPLVLLHITLLPLALPYPIHLIELILPEWIVENFRLLESKLQDSTLMSRGLLIPHPRHEYDLLEERLLESLELATPRLTKSGHFHARRSSGFSSTVLQEDYDFEDDSSTSRDIQCLAGPSDLDISDTCSDCAQPLGLPSHGSGTGKRRWEVRIYAANGLMRSGAWGAAWSEMERVDVEVMPWIPEELKRRLEAEVKMEEEKRLQAVGIKAMGISHAIAHGMVTPPVSEAPHSRQTSKVEAAAEEILMESFTTQQPTPPSMAPRTDCTPPSQQQQQQQQPPPLSSPKACLPADTNTRQRRRAHKDVPLTTALLNYAYLLSQDRRNLVMLGLGFIVLYLCIKPAVPLPLQGGLTPIQPLGSPFQEAVIHTETRIVTSTSTATATATSTETIREVVTETVAVLVDDAVAEVVGTGSAVEDVAMPHLEPLSGNKLDVMAAEEEGSRVASSEEQETPHEAAATEGLGDDIVEAALPMGKVLARATSPLEDLLEVAQGVKENEMCPVRNLFEEAVTMSSTVEL